MLYGARVSLLVGVVSYLIVLAIAIPVGSIAGYYGGWIDNVLMRMVDVVFTIPQVLLVLMFVNWRGPGLTNILLGDRPDRLGDRSAPDTRAIPVASGAGLRQSLAGRRRQRGPTSSCGTSCRTSLTPIIVAATFGIPTAIFTEAAISFVGVGIRPPQASWGQMVGAASQPGRRPDRSRTCCSSRSSRSV